MASFCAGRLDVLNPNVPNNVGAQHRVAITASKSSGVVQ